MQFTRRRFLTTAAGASALSVVRPALAAKSPVVPRSAAIDPQTLALEQAAAKPVLQLKGLSGPVVIESIKLLPEKK